MADSVLFYLFQTATKFSDNTVPVRVLRLSVQSVFHADEHQNGHDLYIITGVRDNWVIADGNVPYRPAIIVMILFWFCFSGLSKRIIRQKILVTGDWNQSRYLIILTFWAKQTKTNTCANREDPDETVRNEPSHQDLHCLPIYFWFLTNPLLASVVKSEFENERVQIRNPGKKELNM